MAQKELTLVIPVHLDLRVKSHNVPDKIKIAERNPCLKRVYRNAAVCAQNVIHIKLMNALLRLLLEFLGRGSKVRVFIAEQLIGNLTRENNSQIGVFVDIFADEIHAY